MGKSVLLISPKINDLYKDIISQLNNWGMEVDFIEDYAKRGDPNFIRNEWHVIYDNIFWKSHFGRVLDKEWKILLTSSRFNKIYDYLLVIDGQSLPPYLFHELRSRNPNLWAANYLFDSSKSLYRFQNNFEKFDFVASFDRRDCKEYGLLFLPIYWCEPVCIHPDNYDLFGFGTYGLERYCLFSEIEKIACKLGLKSFIKLYCGEINNFKVYNAKRQIRRALGMKSYFITPEHYNSSLITHQTVPSTQFRNYIYSSKITIDTVNFDQDGMTARFMWALGAGKKIITTNTNILRYDCYNSEQIYVIDNPRKIQNLSALTSFIKSDYIMSEEQKNILLPWRLDNWVATLLNLNSTSSSNTPSHLNCNEKE